MKLLALRVAGFGTLGACAVDFGPGLSVVHGANETGKSTLCRAVLASLFGLSRKEKDAWRPWTGERFATALVYDLSDGRRFEVHREYERDAKGVRVFDASGNDVSADASIGKTVAPGHAHLGLSLDVALNTAFVAQNAVTIDGERADRVGAALARALDGGPKEHAALDALERLDDALAQHVGRKKATVNAPLRHAQGALGEARAQASRAREGLAALEATRARHDAASAQASDLERALRESERRGRALRAQALQIRLDALREIADEQQALEAERARYDDVATYPVEDVVRLEALLRAWETADALARAHADDARTRPLCSGEELRAARAGPDDQEFEALTRAATAAARAAEAAQLAAAQARAAPLPGGGELIGAALAAGLLAAASASAAAATRAWALALALAVVAAVALGFGGLRRRQRNAVQREARERRRLADEAAALEGVTAARLATLLEPLRAVSVAEVARRRDRARALAHRCEEARRCAQRASASAAAAARDAAAFDALAVRLTTAAPSRAAALTAAREQAGRKAARDGIVARLAMLAVRRADVLRDDDVQALRAELAALHASGGAAEAATEVHARTNDAEAAELRRRVHAMRLRVVEYAAELRSAEAQVGDLAALDERIATLEARVARLEGFEAAVELARRTIDERTRDAHQRFAHRLTDYASATFARVTGQRYVDLQVDPTTLALHVRVPETGAFAEVARLSTGTREQAYLMVRLAMARMVAEGSEPPPVLLDDPFAYWDDERIERALPVLEAAAVDAQIIVFTTSRALADAVARRGGRALALAELRAGAGRAPLNRDEDLTLLTQA